MNKASFLSFEGLERERVKGQKMNRITAVQECDARDDDQGTEAGNNKKL